jgi:hypothetical protein
MQCPLGCLNEYYAREDENAHFSESMAFHARQLTLTYSNAMFESKALSQLYKRPHTLMYFGGYETLVEAKASKQVWRATHHGRELVDDCTLPMPRNFAAAVRIYNGGIYLCGGQDDDTKEGASTKMFHLSVDGQWGGCSDMPIARSTHCIVTIRRYLYAIGGCTTPVIATYDIVNDSWCGGGPSLSSVRYMSCATSIYDTIYVFGGSTAPNESEVLKGGEMIHMKPQGDRAMNQPIAPAPTARTRHTCVVVEEKILIMGGRVKDGGATFIADTIEEYTPSTNSWKIMKYPLPSLPTLGIAASYHPPTGVLMVIDIATNKTWLLHSPFSVNKWIEVVPLAPTPRLPVCGAFC